MLNTDLKISVIMPVYNAEKYLEQCIESVLNQTYLHWELIIIDDGSTDNSAEICRLYINKDPRIKLILQENSGVSTARNVGISHAQGAYIAFIDADDAYSSEQLERMIEKTGNDIDLVYADYFNLTGQKLTASREKVVEGIVDRETFIDYVLIHSVFTTVWRGLFRASVCKMCTFSSLKFCEDLFFILEFASYAKRVSLVNEAYYHYRRDNLSSMTNNETAKKYLVDYAKLPVLLYEYFMKNQFCTVKHAEIEAIFYHTAEERIIKAASYKEYMQLMHDTSYMKGKAWCIDIFTQNGVETYNDSLAGKNITVKYLYQKSKYLLRYFVHRIKRMVKN